MLVAREALAEHAAEAVVAGVFGEAGDDEVADAGEAEEGFGLAAEGDAEAGHFREAAGDEGGEGVVAESEAFGDAGGDGEDVLDGAAEFDAGDVVAGVGAEVGGGEELLECGGDGVVRGADDGGRWRGRRAISSAWVGPERTATGLSGKDSSSDLAHAFAGIEFDAFGAGEEDGIGADAGGVELVRNEAGDLGGDDEEERGRRCGRPLVEVGGGGDGFREIDAGEVFGVLMLGVNLFGDVGFVSVEDGLRPRDARRTPRAVPQDPEPRMTGFSMFMVGWFDLAGVGWDRMTSRPRGAEIAEVWIGFSRGRGIDGETPVSHSFFRSNWCSVPARRFLMFDLWR